jgi:hypothetical protein
VHWRKSQWLDGHVGVEVGVGVGGAGAGADVEGGVDAHMKNNAEIETGRSGRAGNKPNRRGARQLITAVMDGVDKHRQRAPEHAIEWNWRDRTLQQICAG